VGANLGIYTQILRRYSRDVVAVEPNPELSQRLRRAFSEQVRVIEAALSSSPGRATIHVPVVRGREIDTRASLDPALHAGLSTRSLEVRMLTLDQLELRDVGFLKIDVEGHELEVVRGGLELLRASQPRLLIEIEERHNAGAIEQMLQLLSPLGYRGYFVAGSELVEIEHYDAQRHQPAAGAKRIGGGRSRRYINNFIFLAEHDRVLIPQRLRECLQRPGSWLRLRQVLHA
jgi:FkbM family methyltransferase